MVMRLMSHMTCRQCGNKAPLAYGPLDKKLEDGTTLHLANIPMYHCLGCGSSQMELMAKAVLERTLQRFIDLHVEPGAEVRLNLELTPAGDSEMGCGPVVGVATQARVQTYELAFA